MRIDNFELFTYTCISRFELPVGHRKLPTRPLEAGDAIFNDNRLGSVGERRTSEGGIRGLGRADYVGSGGERRGFGMQATWDLEAGDAVFSGE